MALVTPVSASPIYVGDEAGCPRNDNGEANIAQVLTRLNIDFLYEAFLYPIRVDEQGNCTHGFCPDFWIAGSKRLPECNIEVTWPDARGRKASNPRRHRTIDQVIGEKRAKICQVYRVYSVPTLLLDHRACLAIERRHGLLRDLLGQLHRSKDDHDGYFRPSSHHLK